MCGIKLSGLSNNHCLVCFSNTDNSMSKCELSNIAQPMLPYCVLTFYEFTEVNKANRILKKVDLKPPMLVGFVSVTE